MTDNLKATQSAEAGFAARVKSLEEENELLLLQLHQVQEELERYYLKCREIESGVCCVEGKAAVGGWVDDELPALQAEVIRLTSLIETQTWQREIESNNALNARLGDILIQSVSPCGSIMGLPVKLLGIWRASKAVQPSAALGGKNFDKVIQAFQSGGLESVDQLLAAESAPEMRAKALTALARYQMKSRLFADAALSARRAYEEEPKPFRLKWLAFRLHEAGDIARADACLGLLPSDTPFSDSEASQRDQVLYEAKRVRLREAKQKTDFESRRQAMEGQLQTLRQDRDKHVRLAAEQHAEIECLQQGKVKLEQEKLGLIARNEESVELAGERLLIIDSLRQARDKFEQERALLKKTIEELTRARDEQAKLAQDKTRQNEQLQRTVRERQAADAESAIRHGVIREEVARAEAQLDLLKEIFLREPGL